MATQPGPAPLSVPGSQMQKEIENILDAPRKILEAISDLEKERANAQSELVKSVALDLATGVLNINSVVEKQTAWKIKDDGLGAKITACKQLGGIIADEIKKTKAMQPAAIAAVLQFKVTELEKESVAQQDKAALLKRQIGDLKAQLGERESTTDKRAGNPEIVSLKPSPGRKP
jgi:hypothetical protein